MPEYEYACFALVAKGAGTMNAQIAEYTTQYGRAGFQIMGSHLTPVVRVNDVESLTIIVLLQREVPHA